MNVGELIDHLSGMNPAAEVRIEFAGEDYRDVSLDSEADEHGQVTTVWIGVFA